LVSVKLNSREKIVEFNNLSFRAGSFAAFNEVNWSVSSGETAVISGPTGSGKSFLIQLILGLERSNSGQVLVFGQEIRSKNERQLGEIRRKIGGVGGIFNLIPGLTLADNVGYPLILRGDKKSLRVQKMAQVIGQFNLTTRKTQTAERLTRGEKIMAMLARGVVADQPLLLLDEPLDLLEEPIADEIIAILKRLSVSGHTMIVFTTGQAPIEIPAASYYKIEGAKIR
jgi:ABC-type lipoprotein export system ATPase subunit